MSDDRISKNLHLVYSTLKSEGYTDIGDEQDFIKKMQDEQNRLKVYNALKGAGYSDIGSDFKSFSGMIYSVPQTKPQASEEPAASPQSYPTTIQTNVVEPVVQTSAQAPITNGQARPNSAYNAESENIVDENTRVYTSSVDVKSVNRKQVSSMTQQIDDLLTQKRGEATGERIERIQKASDKGFGASIMEAMASTAGAADPNDMQAMIRMKSKYGNEDTPETVERGKQIRQLETAQRSMRDAQRIINEADHNAQEGTFGKWLESSFAGGAARGFGQKLFDADTWDMGVSDLGDNLDLMNALKKADNGEQLSDAEQILLDAKAVELATNAYFGSYVGRGYKAGGVTAESIPFMIEMCINPASAAGKGATSMLTRYALKRFGKQVVKNNAKKYAAAKVGARVVGDLAGSATMAGTTGSIRVAAGTVERMNGDVQADTDEETGETIYGGHTEGDSFGKALGKSFASTTIENYSEMVGEYFSPITSAAGKYISKGMNSIGLKGVNDFIENVAASDVARVVGDFEKHAKWNGVFGEYAEEVAGNMMNALVVGDMTMDTAEGTGVFNLDQNIDTFLGVSLMGGFMSGVKTLGYRTPKYRARKAMTAAEDAAAAKFTDSVEWGAIRNTIAFGNDEEVAAKVAEVVSSDVLTDEQKIAALEYAKCVETYKGMLRGEDARRTEYAGTADVDAETSYDNGYTLATDDEMNDAKNMFDYQSGRMKDTFGQDYLDQIDKDPIGALAVIAERDDLSEDDKQLALDYVNAKATYDGMIDRVRDDIESRVAASDNAVDSRVNNGTGMITPATMKLDDRKVYIVDGTIVMHDDGSMVDIANSSESILVRDAETGNLEWASPHDVLSVDEVINPAEEKEAAQQAIREQYAEEQANRIDGVLPFNQGDSYAVLDENGTDCTVTIIADNGDGTVQLAWNGDQNNIETVSKERVQDLRENYNLARLQQYESQRAIQRQQQQEQYEAQRPSYNLNDEITIRDDAGNLVRGSITTEENDDGEIEVYTETPINGKKIHMFTRDQLDTMLEEHNGELVEDPLVPPTVQNNVQNVPGTTESVPAAEETVEVEPMPMVGEGEDAEPDFGSATPQRAHDYIFNESGLDEADAAAFTKNNVEAANKELEKIKNKKPKMGTSIAKFNKDKAEWDRKVNEAQAKADYWKQVKEARDKVLADRLEEQQERERKQIEQAQTEEAAYREEMARKKSEQEALGTNNVSPSIREKWASAPKVEGAQDVIVLPNGEKVAGRYYLVESGAASASHDSNNGFAKTEGFPVDENGGSVNDRDYERDKDAQRVTRDIANNYDSRAVQTPVVVSQDGIVLSGNGRTMAGELAAAQNTDAAYNSHIAQYPTKWGFTKEQVEGMQHPRVVFVPDAAMPYTAETFAKFNQQEMKGQSKTEQAVKLGKVVSDKAFNRIIRIINRFDTLGEFYADAKATRDAISELQGDGVLSQAQMTEMFDGYGISAVGKEILENTLIGKAFGRNPDAVREITEFKSMRQSIITALAEISNNLSLGKDYSLESELAQAIDLVYQARKGGSKFGEPVSWFARQQNLDFFGLNDTVADYNNATMLMIADIINDNRSSRLKKYIQIYNHNAKDSANGQLDLFTGSVKSKEYIINEVKQLFNNGSEEEQQKAAQESVARRKAESVQENGTVANGSEAGDTDGEAAEHPVERTGDRSVSEWFGPIYTQFEGKADEAEAHLRETKDGVAKGALTYPGVAPIDLVWGDMKAGYMKIVIKHPEVVGKLQSILSGTSITSQSENRIVFESDTHKMIVSRMKGSQPTDNWLLTAYEKKEKPVSASSSDIETEPEGKRNGTATPQNGAISDGKYSENPASSQAKGEKVAENQSPGGVQAALAAAEADVNTNPTDGQKEAGNYKKGHVRIDGFDVSIEQPKGSVRRGTDADGKQWSVTMSNTYGYIRGTEGVDGDHIDVFFSDDPSQGDVFVVDQVNRDGSFDEHKVMYGFPDIESARKAYLSNYEEGWQGLGAITPVSKEEFKKWIDSSHRKTKPFAEYKSVKTTEGQNAPADKDLRRKLADFNVGDVVRDYYNQKLYRIKKHSKNGVSTIAELDAEGNEVGTTTMNTYNNSRYSLAEAPVKEETPTISQDSEQVSDQDNAPYTIAPAQYTTKKGKVLDMHLVTFGRELSKEEIRAGKELAKESHGWWDREKAGFMMRDEESAKALAEALSNEEAVQDAQPISLGDITAASNEYAVIEKPETWVGKTFYTNGMKLKCTDVSNGYATFDNLTTFMSMGFDVHTVQNYMRSGEWAVVSSKTNRTGNKQEKKSETKDVQTKQEEKEAKSKWVNDEDAERFEELRKRLKAKLRGQMNMGADPEIFAIGVEMSYLMLKKGARKFVEFASNLIEALGDEVRPYIKAFYNGARDLPEMAEYEKDMTPYDEVRAFDVMNFDKQGAKDVFATAEHVVREQAAEREAKEATNKLKRKRNARRKETEQIGDVELVASSLPEDQEILRASRKESGKNGSPVQGNLFGDISSDQNGSEQDKPSHRFFVKYVGDTIQLRRYTMMPNGMPIEDARTVASANSEREMLDIINNPANRFGNEIDDVRRDLVAAIEEKVRASAANMQGKEAVNKEEGVTLHRRTKAEGAFSDDVAKRMKAALTSGEKPFRSIVDLRKLAIECGMAVDSEGRDDILIQELVEDGLAKVGREIAGKARRRAVFKPGSSFFPKDVFEQICRLYEMQPTIGQRSSNRIKMQQYSTPLPMGFVADMFVDERGKIAGDEMILEPTAGNGLLVYAVPSAKIHVNELDEVRYENLRLGGYRELSKQDATLPFDGGRRYAGVISNPPFGRADAKMYDGMEISSLEAQIALNALESMKDNGRAAIIVGGNMEYQPNGAIKGADRSFYSYLYDHYNVKGVVDMDGSLYRKQGTTYPTRMILIEGRRSDEERAQERVYPPVRDKAVRKATSFDELYDIVNGLLNSNEKTNGTAVLRREQGLGSDSESRPGNRDNRSDHQQPQTNDRERGGLERGGSVVQGGLQQGQPSVLGERGRDSGTGRTGRGADEGRRGDERNAGRGVLAQDDKRVGDGTPGRRGVGLTSGTSSTANEDGRATGVSAVGSQSSNVSQPSSGSNVTIERRRTLTDEKTLYRPHSKAFSLESVAPAAMTDAMDDALKRIEDEVGDIDGFVQQELGYDSVESLHNALAAEQVDSVAMAIYQMKRGEAMIIGDQTGVGKGRQMAALIRWAVRQGKKPVFITQKADLFSDLYRDLVDIGSGELRPFIFNSDGDIKDSKNQTVYKPLSNERMRSVLRGDALPDGYDFVVLTYSQLNKGDDISRREAEELAKKSGKRVQKKKKDKDGVVVSPKNEFLRRLAKDNFILLDESHTAAGDGNTGSYLQSIMRIVKAATFASATFAKRPDTMPLYAIRTAMSKANVESSKLIQIIEKGGVTLQEIMSRALSAVGQMVRRERDMSDVRTDWKTVDDAEIVERAKRNYDKTVKAFNAIIRFQKEFVDPYIEMISESMAAQMKSASKTRGTDKLGLNNVPFASKAYNYTKQLLLALKVDAIVDEVDREIKAGRHPVIALESTMESVLDGYNPGEVLDNATFGASLMKGLEGTLTYTVKDEKNKEVKHVIPLESLPAQAAQAYEEVKQLIRESTGEVFVSPIDEIVMKLNAKGYSVGELTGRDKYVSMEDGRAVVRKRADKDKKRMTMDFNSGKTDVLILNKSASTGISLHASKRFGDQRQRTMVMAQPLSDINDYMQMIGRIDRTGQVHRGYYINLGLPVPAENRFMMMLSTKLKSLNANTTTSQDSSQNDVDAPDLLNKYGSQVIVEYLRDHPGMHEKMGSPLNLKENQNLEDYAPQEDDARKVTGYVALLSVKEQEEFYAEVVERYNTLINYLNETDNNDLKISVMPLRAKTVSRKVASKGNESNGLNPFAQDSYVEQVEMDVLRKPYKMDEVKKLFDQLNKGVRPAEFIDSVVQKLHDETQAKIAAEDERFEQEIAGLDREVELRTEKIRQQKKLSDEDKAKAVEEERAKLIERMNRAHARNLETINGNESKVQSALNRFSIGKSYLIPDVMGTELFTCSSPGILVGFKLKDNGITPSTSFAVFAVLDGRRRIEVKLGDTKSLDTIYKHTVQNYDRAQMVNPSNWDSQIPQTTRTGGYILTGNIIQAFSDSQGKEGGFAGKLVSYTDVDGNIHDGILMPQSWTPKLMKNAGVPINARQAAIERGDVVTSIDNGVRLEKMNRWSSYYVLSVPKSKKQGGAYYLNDELLSLVDRDGFQQRGNVMRAHIDGKDNLKKVLDLLSQIGVRVDDASDTDVNGENDEDLMFREGDESDSIEAVNRRFNKRLDELIKDPTQSNRILHLGTPGQFLTDGGISNVEILLDFDKLVRKSREEYRNNHPFDISDVKDLPVYINDPIAVFDNTNGMDSGRVILTEMEKDGRNFIVAVRATEQKRKGGFVLEVNEITTIYPKEEKGIVKWMIDGNATNINKQKALRFIEALQPHVGTTITSEELSDAAKVVESFENPRVDDKKIFDGEEDDEHLYRIVDDKSTVERLEAEPKMKAYRAMQVIDGRLYSPMAAKVDGKLSSDNPFDTWTEAEETTFDFTPEQIAAMEKLDKSDKTGEVEIIKGKLRYRKDSKTGRGTLQFHLVKGDGTDLWAAYNPYIHSSLMMLNDQFTSAYKRPNIVVVEVEIPESELTSGYRAKLAKDAVGMAEWKAGPVAGQLPSDMGRKVMLSRWSKVKRIVPYSEVADHVAAVLSTAEQKKGNKLRLPIDSFHPELRKELEKRGFEFEYGLYTKGKTDKKGNYIKAWDERSEEEKQKEYKGATYMDDAAIEQLNEEFKGKWMRREGDGPIDDDSLAYENDPISKVLGKSRFSRKQRKAFAERERSRMVDTVKRLAEKLHLDNVEIVTDVSTLDGKKQRAKGFYNRKTGKITIVIPNNMNTFDVEQTLLHEAVAHYGLRQLFGEHFDTFLDNVFKNADYDVRRRIVALAAKNGWDFRKATEEYLAMLAENTEFEHTHASWWGQIKQLFLQMLHKIGFEDFTGVTLGDNELRYILWRSYENLAEPVKYRSIFGEAADVAKQYELGVRNYAATPSGNTSVADIDEDEPYRDGNTRSVSADAVEEYEILYRDGDVMDDRDKAIVRDRYDRQIQSGMYQFREAMQDSMLSLRRFQEYVEEATGEKVKDFENAYMAENALSSKNHAEQDLYGKLLFNPLLDEIHRISKEGSSRDEVTRYMMAKHGLERNEVMARRAAERTAMDELGKDLRAADQAVQNDPLDQDALDALDAVKQRMQDRGVELYDENRERDYGGITGLMEEDDLVTAEGLARQLVADFENNHDVDELWARCNACTKATLEKTYKSGLLSKSGYDEISGMYEYYIPLRGFDATTSDEVYSYLNHERSGFSTPLKKAKGRKSVADNPIATIANMADSAIVQGNRNMMKQKFLKFAMNHPSDAVSINRMWLRYDDVNGVWEAVTAQIDENDSPEEVLQKTEHFEETMKQLAEADPDHYKRGKDAANIPYKTLGKSLNEHQVHVKLGGEDYILTINGSPRVAQALNGLTNPDNDTSGAVGAILKAGEYVNRQMSAFYTTRNPEFVLSNFLRDALYANSTMWVRERPNYAIKFNKNFMKVNPKVLYGLIKKHNAGTLDMNVEIERAFYQFMMNGGETGYTVVKDIEKQKKLIRKYVRMKDATIPAEAAWQFLGDKLDDINRSVENCARFAAFLTSRQMGRSVEKSVWDAKEVSVNFNKKGAGSTFMGKTGQTKLGNLGAFSSGLGRSFYVFWNAAVQGTTNFASLHKHHTGKALMLDAGMFLLGAIISGLGGGDDDDYWNLPSYVRRNNICFKIPFTHSFVCIPLGIEQRAIYGLGELFSSLASGRERMSGKEIAKEIAGSLSSMLPLDLMESNGDISLSTVSPSYVKPFVEADNNKDWKGMPIYKDTPYNKDDPEWTKASKRTNQYLVDFAMWCNEVTGGDDVKKGWLNFNPSNIEHVFEGVFGGVSTTANKLVKTGEMLAGKQEFDWSNILLASRVIKSADENAEARRISKEYWKYYEEYRETKRIVDHYEDQEAEGILGVAEKLDFMYNSPEYGRYEIVDDYYPDIKYLSDELNETTNAEERNELETEMNNLKRGMVDAIRAYDDARK